MAGTKTLTVTLESGIVYVSGTVNGVSVTWTQTDTTRWQAVCDRAEDNRYVVSLTAISSSGKTNTSSFVLFYGLNLITDRTRADVERVRYLAAKYPDWTDDEAAEWWADPKGAYNASDLNRVEGAVSYLAELLREAPKELKDYADSIGVAWDEIFDVPYDPDDYDPEVKLNWHEDTDTQPDDPSNRVTVSQMARYLSNVELLITALEADYPDLPESMDNLDHTGANAIEKALLVLYDALQAERTRITALMDSAVTAYYYAGEICAGEI